VQALVRLGETERAQRALDALSEQDRDRGALRAATAALRLAQGDPGAASARLAPVVTGAAPALSRNFNIESFLLEAIARDELGDPAAAARALERALGLAEPDGILLPFLLQPARGLLERHVRQRTEHAALIWQILDELAGLSTLSSAAAEPPRLHEPISVGETRVLRYLPTNLPVPEIAGQLTLSANTVRTHIRHLYEKLGAHSRTEAVERARSLGLLAPASRGSLGRRP
jgi:LuxR family maltose regulon positive regulatory protein